MASKMEILLNDVILEAAGVEKARQTGPSTINFKMEDGQLYKAFFFNNIVHLFALRLHDPLDSFLFDADNINGMIEEVELTCSPPPIC